MARCSFYSSFKYSHILFFARLTSSESKKWAANRRLLCQAAHGNVVSFGENYVELSNCMVHLYTDRINWFHKQSNVTACDNYTNNYDDESPKKPTLSNKRQASWEKGRNHCRNDTINNNQPALGHHIKSKSYSYASWLRDCVRFLLFKCFARSMNCICV